MGDIVTGYQASCVHLISMDRIRKGDVSSLSLCEVQQKTPSKLYRSWWLVGERLSKS